MVAATMVPLEMTAPIKHRGGISHGGTGGVMRNTMTAIMVVIISGLGGGRAVNVP